MGGALVIIANFKLTTNKASGNFGFKVFGYIGYFQNRE